MKISIIMPTYCEIESIKKNIQNYCSYFKEKKQEYEIIVSCNGCDKKTMEIVKESSKKNQNVKYLEAKKKTGKGKAIIEGFKIATGEIIGFVDADDAYEYSDIIPLLNNIKVNNCDIVIASKWKDVTFKKAEGSLKRKILGRIWNRFVRILFNINFRDTQGGAKFLKRCVLDEVIEKLNCKGFEFDVELLWRVSQKKYKIKEVFVPSKYDENTSVTTKDYFSMLYNVIKLRIGANNG